MRRYLLFALMIAAVSAHGQSGSVLASGDWYKIAVPSPGVYRIDYNFLRDLGINPGNINPSHIRIFGNEGGMLPQPNNAPRPDGLQENAIFVSGEADGRFDANDYILFYAEGPDRAAFEADKGIFYYENNLYSDENFYFLNLSNVPGKRINTAENPGDASTTITTYYDYCHYELDSYNDQQSGREWFGEKFGISIMEKTFAIPITGVVAGSEIKIVSDVMGQSHSPASFDVFLNDVEVGSHIILPIPNSRYREKGLDSRDTFLINATDVGIDPSSSLRLSYSFTRGTGYSQAYLDYFLVTVERELRLYENQNTFTIATDPLHPVSRLRVSNADANTQVWDITDIYNPKRQQVSLNNGAAECIIKTDVVRRLIAFNGNFQRPSIIGRIENQDLRSIGGVNLLIVTHPLFKDEALRLAAHRQSHSGWQVRVVTTDEVYNDFSSGRQDITAIRDFVKAVHDKSPNDLKALLLFGKGSYDYKDRVPNNTNFVPTYQSRNSLHPLQSYSSDDYYAFLEDDEGYWDETSNAIHTLDIGVGRLPVTSISEARAIVDKIIAYDTDPRNFGQWRKQVVFVADDGNNEDGFHTVHQDQADQLATFLEVGQSGIDAKKLFMGSYQKVVKPNGESIPDLTADIVRSFDQGALIINYTGHGSEVQWGDENVFNNLHIRELDNSLYPFLVTATCEFGRHDNPTRTSSAEVIVTQPNGGAIGLVTTSRLVRVETNFNLNLAFYDALLQRDGDNFFHVGEVFRQTKNNSISGVLNRNFSLLADPSMTLALPPHRVVITELKTASGSDTLKALSTVVARGEIQTFSGVRLDDFNGIVVSTLFDKQHQRQTIGRNSPPYVYDDWDNTLFRGQATVKDGEFSFTFMLPRNIDYTVDMGKFSLYAYDTADYRDASGVYTDFKVGATEPGVLSEAEAPSIRLFMDDTTFMNGGIVDPDTWLIARVNDNSGVNISSYGIGNSIIATLDNDAQTFVLNDYYIADVDDPTSGWIRFPIRNLEPGPHTFTVKAWDVFNNSATATLDFIVTDGHHLVIESFGNYPNPFRDNTTLFFTHNRSGDDLRAELYIQDVAGAVIKTFQFDLPDSDYRTDLVELSGTDFQKKAASGLYIARLIVRSLTNGSKNERVTKLFLVK